MDPAELEAKAEEATKNAFKELQVRTSPCPILAWSPLSALSNALGINSAAPRLLFSHVASLAVFPCFRCLFGAGEGTEGGQGPYIHGGLAGKVGPPHPVPKR